jgi:hypothetical protein
MLAVVARARDFSLEMIDSRKLSGFSTAGGLQQVHNIVRLSSLKFSILGRGLFLPSRATND